VAGLTNHLDIQMESLYGVLGATAGVSALHLSAALFR